MVQKKEMTPEEILRQQTWRYLGIGALWLALILSGIAFERIGLTTGILSSILPGEVTALRRQLKEEETSLAALTKEREELREQLEQLRTAKASYDACRSRLEQLKMKQASTLSD